jgi:hypothetical protein
MSKAAAPSRCPSCNGVLNPVRYICSDCGTEVSGNFSVCPFCSLDGVNRDLLELFLLTRGNLKAVQRMLGVSYPTARLRIEEMFNALEERISGESVSMDVLERLHRGEISVEDAIDSLGSKD